MKSIWKFEVPIEDRFEIMMPKNSEILTVQAQRDKVNIWAIVILGNDIEKREFVIIGTGHKFVDNFKGKHVGTVQVFGGDLVWHLFEVKT